MDKNGFKEFYARLYPEGNADKFCKYSFKLFDRDNSGFICFNEFIMAVSITSVGYLRKKLNVAFMLYDIDKNGSVNKKEIVKILDAMNRLVNFNLVDYDDAEERNKHMEWLESVASDVIKSLDMNGDSCISRDEFIEGCMNNSSIKELLVPYL
jgi:Ca2+-binding EF-hand superfamily protein